MLGRENRVGLTEVIEKTLSSRIIESTTGFAYMRFSKLSDTMFIGLKGLPQ